MNALLIQFSVRFHTKESACQAICGLHGSEFRGHTIKCGWGREDSSNDRSNTSSYNNVLPSHQSYNSQPYDAVKQFHTFLFLSYCVIGSKFI